MRRLGTATWWALVLALGAGCELGRVAELGAPCEVDRDCADGYFCGADDAAPEEVARVCVPEAACDPARFAPACAGGGYYACVDGQVTFTECASGCSDGTCVGE